MEFDLKTTASILFVSIIALGVVGVIFLARYEGFEAFWASVIVALLILVVTQYSSRKLERKLIRAEKIKNLQLQLFELKLSLMVNRQQIEKSVLLQDQYWSIISTIESATQE